MLTPHVPPPHMPRYARARQLVYEALRQHGELTAKQLERHTRLKDDPVWHALEALRDEGLVVRERAEHIAFKPYLYRLREVTQ